MGQHEMGKQYRDAEGRVDGVPGAIYTCIGHAECSKSHDNDCDGCVGHTKWKEVNYSSCCTWDNYTLEEIGPIDLVKLFRDKIRKEVENNGN